MSRIPTIKYKDNAKDNRNKLIRIIECAEEYEKHPVNKQMILHLKQIAQGIGH